MSAKISVGGKAPGFRLAHDGQGEVSLDDFKRAGATVLGVSADPLPKLDKFKAKHGLSIMLASDESLDMLKVYGVWAKKSMYGRSYMGILRNTYLIDSDGRIARIWEKVKVAGHAAEVLEAAKAL